MTTWFRDEWVAAYIADASEKPTTRQAARAITQLYDCWLDGTGLEAPQFALLMALNGHGDASQAAIGRRYGLDATACAVCADRAANHQRY